MAASKKIIILLVIAALIGAGFLAYRARLRPPRRTAPGQATTSNSGVNLIKQQEFYDALKKSAALDQDLDGISDSEETKYQTSPTSSDTDSDGLTDRNEIFIYKTNPLKADTDGDSFSDGYEVRRGLNPNGAGKMPTK